MRGHVATLAAGALLALFGWMATSVSREHSTTADEILHVTAGCNYWLADDYRLQPENGNLPQRWVALPLLAQGVRFPARTGEAWQTGDVAELGHQFFYELGNDLPRMLASARMMTALLGLACGALVFAWARSLSGAAGGLVAVALFAFCPNLLAHGGLATSDMAATLGFLAAVLASWRLLHRVSPGRVAAVGLAVGALALSKFSAPLLLPMIALMGLARAWRGATLPVQFGRIARRWRSSRAAAAIAGAFVVAGLLAYGVVWSAYGFRFAGMNPAERPGSYHQPWARIFEPPATRPAAETVPTRAPPGVVQTAVQLAVERQVLPEPWLYGFAHVVRFSQWRPAFLQGEYRATGWARFFPTAFLLKTTLPVLLLAPIAAMVWARRIRRDRRGRLLYRLVPLDALVAVYGASALATHLNIGLRHILPLYPVLYIACGTVATGQRRWFTAMIAALLAWHALASLWIRPHYLAYFNPLAGGPSAGYRQLVDSSLDWGQDLPGLKRWLEAHSANGEKVFLSYFGAGSPRFEGIHASRLADGFFDLRGREVAPEMTGGIYCISATMFQQVYTLVRHGWTPEHERRYTELRHWRDAWRTGRDTTPRDAATSRLIELEHLRFGRLCAGLQRRTPDDEVGYSILIFRLTDAEVRALLDGPPPFPS